MEQKPTIIHPKFSHLEKGVRPIQVCLDFRGDIHDARSFDDIDNLKEEAQDVEFSTSRKGHYEKHNMLIAKRGECVISDLNEKNKFSERYFNCVGLAIVGVDKDTNKNISILTHQEPKTFLRSESFKSNLAERTRAIVAQSKPGTIDAVLLGGNAYLHIDKSVKEYKDSIQNISKIVTPLLGFEPTVITGPKLNGFYTSAYLETASRKLHILTPRQEKPVVHEDFKPSEVDVQLEKYNEPTKKEARF